MTEKQTLNETMVSAAMAELGYEIFTAEDVRAEAQNIGSAVAAIQEEIGVKAFSFAEVRRLILEAKGSEEVNFDDGTIEFYRSWTNGRGEEQNETVEYDPSTGVVAKWGPGSYAEWAYDLATGDSLDVNDIPRAFSALTHCPPEPSLAGRLVDENLD